MIYVNIRVAGNSRKTISLLSRGSAHKLTDLAVINMFQGINIPTPCMRKMINTILYLK